ncbi:MAG TPA: hypothetical protein VGZ26_01530 [Pirellulales bacterium]|jgi:hypothetical protein|nr:hypothetical protein [Pirellulales bacterium]
MVRHLVQLSGVRPLVAAQSLLASGEQAKTLLDRLDPERRAKVVMALLGVVLAGLAIVALTVLLGRHFLRAARKPIPPTPRHEDDWFRKPLVPRDPKTPQAHEPE